MDGIILIGSVFQEVKDNSHILNVAKQVPVVTLNAQIIGENVYSVYCDDARGMYDAAAYLLSHGRKRVAYIYDVETFSAHNKQNGYIQAVEAFQVEPICMQCQSGLSGGLEAAYKLLDTYPDIDGILCSEDMLAAGVLKALRKRQIAIPDQVAVVGYNDILFPECTNPELASVDGKVRILSEYAFDCMYRVLEDGIGPQSIVISPHFIVRESAMLD